MRAKPQVLVTVDLPFRRLRGDSSELVFVGSVLVTVVLPLRRLRGDSSELVSAGICGAVRLHVRRCQSLARFDGTLVPTAQWMIELQLIRESVTPSIRSSFNCFTDGTSALMR